MRLAIARICFLTLLCTCGGLKLQKNRGQPLHHEQKVRQKIKQMEWVANVSDSNSSTQDVLQSNLSSQYCGCKGSSCFINANKVEAELKDQLILILGCSLDVNAIDYFCSAAAGTYPQQVVSSSPMSYLAFCVVGHFTVVYAFHPGASAPPYAQDYNPGLMGTTRDIITKTKLDVKAKFGREPTAVVLDASLWDVSNWWQKAGWPAYPYPIPAEFIYQWCNKDVPELLSYVSNTYPNTPVAFRTPPTVFANPNGYGLSPFTVDNMVSCIESYKDASNRIFGAFGLIDYHHFVDQLLQSTASPAAYYKDSLHPGPLLSLTYMNSVLAWVNGQSHSGQAHGGMHLQ